MQIDRFYINYLGQFKRKTQNDVSQLNYRVNNLTRILQRRFTLPLLLTISSIMLSFISLVYVDNNNTAMAQQLQQQQPQQRLQQTSQGAPLALLPGLTGNVLATVSFLIGTSSFILGLRIQSASRAISQSSSITTTAQSASPSFPINKYFDFLILALVLPSIVINVYGILTVGSHLYPEDTSYLALLFVLFIPIGAILFLVKKLN
jgi:hypothetical protein